MVSVGFSQNTFLPAASASCAIVTCQWSGVEITATSISGRANSARKSAIIAQPGPPCFSSTSFRASSRRRPHTSHTATIRQSSCCRNDFKLTPMPCAPRPMQPRVILFEGALAPSSRAGINCGATPAANTPARLDLRKERRVATEVFMGRKIRSMRFTPSASSPHVLRVAHRPRGHQPFFHPPPFAPPPNVARNLSRCAPTASRP